MKSMVFTIRAIRDRRRSLLGVCEYAFSERKFLADFENVKKEWAVKAKESFK